MEKGRYIEENNVAKRVYSINEIAEILDVNIKSAYELARAGKFRVIKVGRYYRIPKASFDEWLSGEQKG